MGRSVGVPKGDNIGMVKDLNFDTGSIFVLNFFPTGARLAPVHSTTYSFLHKNAGVLRTRVGLIPQTLSYSSPPVAIFYWL